MPEPWINVNRSTNQRVEGRKETDLTFREWLARHLSLVIWEMCEIGLLSRASHKPRVDSVAALS